MYLQYFQSVIPAPFKKGITREIQEDLEKNQHVIIEFLKLVCTRTLVANIPSYCKHKYSISWPCDTKNTEGVFKTLTHYKGKFNKGIISSWENYEEKDVSQYEIGLLNIFVL